MMQEKPKTRDAILAELGRLKLKARHLEEAELALRESEERYRRLLESVTDYVYTVTVQNGRAVSTQHGPGCLHVTGYAPEEYDDDPLLWYRMVHEDDRDLVLAQIGLLQQGLDAPPVEHRILHKDGTTRWVRSTPVIRRDAFGRVAFYDGVIQDITKYKSAEEKVRQTALHDPLTALPNRLLLSDRLGRMLEDARRENTLVAVLFVDLDNFKPVNDQYGHATGDTVLKEASSRLVRHVRASDTVARVGGDEFVVALGRLKSEAAATEVARKLIKAVNRPYRSLGRKRGPGCSIGISFFPADGSSPDELIAKADKAMYHVKNHSRGEFALFARLPARETPSRLP